MVAFKSSIEFFDIDMKIERSSSSKLSCYGKFCRHDVIVHDYNARIQPETQNFSTSCLECKFKAIAWNLKEELIPAQGREGTRIVIPSENELPICWITFVSYRLK